MAFGKKLMRLNIFTLELYEVETDFTCLAQESLSSMAMPRHTEKDLYSMILSPQTKGFKGPVNGFVSRSTASHFPSCIINLFFWHQVCNSSNIS